MSNTFEDMKIWQQAQDICVMVYKDFATIKDYGFRDQIQRAAVSISNNIAEGFERKTNNELVYFLYVAKGSCGELRNMFHLAVRLGYIDCDLCETYLEKSLVLSRMIHAFIKKL